MSCRLTYQLGGRVLAAVTVGGRSRVFQLAAVVSDQIPTTAYEAARSPRP